MDINSNISYSISLKNYSETCPEKSPRLIPIPIGTENEFVTFPLYLKYVNISQCRLSYLPSIHLPFLETLDASVNSITKLDENLNSNFPMLILLELAYNRITELPPMFKHDSLTSLQLDHNLIDAISVDFGPLLPKLKDLNLKRNRLVEIRNISFPGLEKLLLIQNSISHLAPKFGTNLPHLTHLNISHNAMTALENWRFASLSFLNVEFNQISRISNRFGSSMPRLITLILSQNRLNVFTPFSIQSLLHLDCSENLIQSLPEALPTLFPNLKTFNINQNQIADGALYLRFDNLKSLSLSVNRLSGFPSFYSLDKKIPSENSISPRSSRSSRRSSISTLSSTCSSRRNSISTLSSMSSWSSKTSIDEPPLIATTSANTEEDPPFILPTRISTLPNLESLDLSKNSLKFLDTYFLPSLLVLHCSKNQISSISPEFDIQLGKLKVLDLSSNMLNEIPRLTLPSLTTLVLPSNRISFPTTEFSNFPKLMRLDLSNNNISSFTTFSTISTLTYLNLSHNSIPDIPPRITKLFPILRQLNINANPISSLTFGSALLHLESLSASECNLTSIPPLTQFPNLKILKLVRNKISSIPFFSSPKLEELDLRFNIISSVSQHFGHENDLPKIRCIFLRDNDLTSVLPHHPSTLEFVSYLNNPITHLPNEALYSRRKEPLYSFQDFL